MTEPLSPAAQKNESREFLAEWFEYDTNSPSCLKWKKRSPNGRKKAGDFCGYFSKYYRVRLMGHWYQCHRIILILHNINPCTGQVADHINRNRLDNRLENLRWLTPGQNHRFYGLQQLEQIVPNWRLKFKRNALTSGGVLITLRPEVA